MIIFEHQIKSRILSKNFEIYEIDDLITEKIINYYWEDCQISTLFDDMGYLYGLLYLLTGNCHIDWDTDV